MNQIEKFKIYVQLLDEVYTSVAKTAVLDGAPELARQGATAGELVIPVLKMDGLADYDPAAGYTRGNVEFKLTTAKCNFDRGRQFMVDAVDNIDTAGMAFGRLAAEFLRTKVIPELDAFRVATYAKAGEAHITAGVITSGEEAIKAIAAKYAEMTDNEVPEEDRHLFITSTVQSLIMGLDTIKSKAVMDKFASIQVMPSARFYTAIAQLDGKKSGEEQGGFKKADTGKALDFLMIHKPAVIQFQKRLVSKAIAPEDNPDADAWLFNFREVGIADTYKNKLVGIAGQYHE